MKVLKAQSRWKTKELPNQSGTFYTTTEHNNKQNIVDQLMGEYYNDCFITMGTEDILYGEYLLTTELHVDNYAPKFYNPTDVIQRIEELRRNHKIGNDIAEYLLGGK